MRSRTGRVAVSTKVLAMVIVVVIAVGGAGAYFFLNSGANAATNTNSNTTSNGTTSVSLVVPASKILNGSTGAGFYRNQVVVFKYTQAFSCTPALAKFASNTTEANLAAAKTSCEVGGGDTSSLPNSFPVFILVPAFAGLSIFGVPALGATSQGYPVFNNTLIFTQCGAGGTMAACFDHPALVYSSFFTTVEQYIGIKTGYGGLPEGVLPTPAHSHIADFIGGPSIPWYVITVLVFDPNVMPDGSTGQCHQVVASDQTSATSNCLNSFEALGAALTTTTTATSNANKTQNNPIYTALGGPKTQVVIPGVPIVSDISPTNTNLFLYFSVTAGSPYIP